MDITCLNCGELWDVHHVFPNAEPGDVKRRGWVIEHCPCCLDNLTEGRPKDVRERLAASPDDTKLFDLE